MKSENLNINEWLQFAPAPLASAPVRWSGGFMSHFLSTIPTSLWQWIDSDLYACEGFTHALACHRPVWLYQWLTPNAPLRSLVRSMYPNNNEFWFWWAVCPQVPI